MGFFSSLFGGGGGKKGKKIVDAAKRWDLRGRTGQGSMSKVFQAYDRDIGRTVCLKLLDRVKTQKFEERFKAQGLKKPTEGEVCAALSHINCVRTYDHGVTTKGDPYLVMEWIEGRGLNFLIETKNAQLDGNRINYTTQLCDAIAYLHAQKFLHRDLCPRNVMVDQEGVVKLIDFGLTIPYTPQFCVPGNRTGTADYLAPEIIKRTTTDHRVDLFALGVTAYEVFTGGLPWERSLSSDETLRKHLNTPPRDARSVNPKLDEKVAKVLMKAIERDRELRYSTATAFKEALVALPKQDY
ncbi:serine/threonine protein kinase [Fimbriiglobus ruber]|uniref:Serine/threonine protein kinase PrkC, regulator of stationary phase n=1 Tax=Fimbriiglobus ruber TaxID=1908690 RepID=A0A225CYY7_9BACT|nr:serine/threonine-protein kinase [Fimbriiglobus ruber]OWK34462.1 Serine/threonine protein kinase PrkC, regulator of stationary phase [Fimbriiglobus ruber]